MANNKKNTKKIEKKETKAVEKKEVEVAKKIEPKKDQNKKPAFILLVVQFILSLVTLALAVTYMFNNNVMVALQISLALTMIVMGINNLLVYKRKIFTFLYFIIGLILLVLAVLTILGI